MTFLKLLITLLITLISLPAEIARAKENEFPKLRPSRSRRNGVSLTTEGVTTKSSSSSSFDFYVLTMSYQPEFCYQHRHEGFDGCKNPMEFWKNSLTLHGLWPESNDGSWPSTCTNEQFNHTTVEILGRDRFNTYWPNVKATLTSTSDIYYSFWNHEWTKHGTCTGLSQVEYFNTTLNHFLKTPDIIGERYGKSITKQELIDAYKEDGSAIHDVVLVCAGGGKFLSEVRTCVAKDGTGNQAAENIDCIIEVEDEANCRDEIKLAKFYSDKDHYGFRKGILRGRAAPLEFQ